MEKIKISQTLEEYAKGLGLTIHPLDGGIVFIDADNSKYDAVYCIARVISQIKKSHPSLVVTALTVVSTAVCKKGAIVCFEKK